ncbi:unnamed protein product, partial [Toxocara canis]|uniref:ABC transmembrane type-1 domain-containing protein n=1 Tax=Toxocara canis TaxID=6265 RepID=A0A183V903_TOXCA
LGSHAISDILHIEVASYRSEPNEPCLGCTVSRSLYGSSMQIQVLIFLAYQTGIVRAASLIAQIAMLQECFESPLILLFVNLPSTVLGMSALNLLRVTFSSRALAVCQVAMFIFTMQYSCFEFASTIRLSDRTPVISFEYVMCKGKVWLGHGVMSAK